MVFDRAVFNINTRTTMNKGDLKVVQAALITARCISSNFGIKYQLANMEEDDDVEITYDKMFAEDTNYPYRYITVTRKSSGKEIGCIVVNFKQELELVEA